MGMTTEPMLVSYSSTLPTLLLLVPALALSPRCITILASPTPRSPHQGGIDISVKHCDVQDMDQPEITDNSMCAGMRMYGYACQHESRPKACEASGAF